MTKNLKRVAVVWLTAGALLLAWAGLSAGINAGSDSEYADAVETADKRTHFWRVIAGEAEPRPGVLDKLAVDLRNTDDLTRFRGDSNAYGGISLELGYDPFNGVNCSECGELDPGFAAKVAAAENGGTLLREIVADEQPEEPVQVPGPTGWLWLLWFVSGPAAGGWLVFKDRHRRMQNYDRYPVVVRQLDSALGELPKGSPKYTELLTLRNRLCEEVDKRKDYGDDSLLSNRIESIENEARISLEAYTEGNRILTS